MRSMLLPTIFLGLLFAQMSHAQTTLPSPTTAASQPVERTSVIAAARRAFVATQDADLETVKAAIVPLPAERWEVLSAIVNNDSASLALFQAVVKQFGEEGRSRWPEDPEASFAKLMEMVDAGEVTIDGKSATLSILNGKSSKKLGQLHLIKTGEVWKLDVSFVFRGRYGRPLFPDEIQELKQRAASYHKITARVEKGEFADADAVMDAMAKEGLTAISSPPRK